MASTSLAAEIEAADGGRMSGVDKPGGNDSDTTDPEPHNPIGFQHVTRQQRWSKRIAKSVKAYRSWSDTRSLETDFAATNDADDKTKSAHDAATGNALKVPETDTRRPTLPVLRKVTSDESLVKFITPNYDRVVVVDVADNGTKSPESMCAKMMRALCFCCFTERADEYRPLRTPSNASAATIKSYQAI